MLDHVFLEWVAALGPQWKMRHGAQKFILKKLAERVGVPSAVLNRPKQGFALPLGQWMRGELKDLVLTTLLDTQTLQRGYFNDHGIRRMLDEHFQNRRDHSARLWRLLIFELWHRNFLAPVARTAHESLPVSVSLEGGSG
jgi:asparagine synthase (glutamine-hydrolysing)